MWGCGLWVGDAMASRREAPVQIIGELREAGVALAQGLVGGAGLQGSWGDGGRRTIAGIRSVGGMRVAQAKRLGRLGG